MVLEARHGKAKADLTMYLMLTDETNLQPSTDAEFFIYGGLIIPADRLSEIGDRIGQIRNDVGYGPTDKLKFDTRVRPPNVSIEEATAAKRLVIDLCLETGCTFIAYAIMHVITRNETLETRVQYGANSVISRFNQYLVEQDDEGICLVDTLPFSSGNQYLEEKFTEGLTFSNRPSVPLSRIRLFGQTCNNASHVSSAADIVLGSFRYCVNNPNNPDAASDMFKKVAAMMWHQDDGERRLVRERGLILRPLLENIDNPSLRSRYDELIQHLTGLLHQSEEVE